MEKVEIFKVKLVEDKDLFVNNVHIEAPSYFYQTISRFLDNPHREHFIVLGLNTNAGDLLGIRIIDHIMVSDKSYFSLKENKRLF